MTNLEKLINITKLPKKNFNIKFDNGNYNLFYKNELIWLGSSILNECTYKQSYVDYIDDNIFIAISISHLNRQNILKQICILTKL